MQFLSDIGEARIIIRPRNIIAQRGAELGYQRIPRLGRVADIGRKTFSKLHLGDGANAVAELARADGKELKQPEGFLRRAQGTRGGDADGINSCAGGTRSRRRVNVGGLSSVNRHADSVEGGG